MGAKTLIDKVIVAAGSLKNKLRLNKVWLLIVLLAFAVVGVGFGILHKHNNDVAVATTNAKKLADGKKHAQVLQNASILESKQDYAGEAKQLQDYLSSNPPAEYAGQEVIRLAVTYVNANDYDNAITSYQKALDTYPDSKYAAIRGLGFVYMKLGDSTGEKDDYRKALDYFKQSEQIGLADPDKQLIAGSDQSDIRYIEEHLQ